MFFVPAVATLFTLSLCILAVVSGVVVLVRLKKIEWVLYAFLVWTVFESVVLSHVSREYAAYLKYVPELLIYLVSATTCIYAYLHRRSVVGKKWWILFGFLLCSSVVSLVVNVYSPIVWLLGLRQLFRFFTIIALLACLGFQETMYHRIVSLFVVLVVVQVVIGIAQLLSGGALDPFLLSNDDIYIGTFARIGNFEEWWTAGTRMYGTLGRYDRFGVVMAFACIGTVAAWFSRLYEKKYVLWFGILALIGLYFSASRASMIMALVGMSLIGIVLAKNKKYVLVLATLCLFVGGILFIKILEPGSVTTIVQRENASFTERLFEAVSPRALLESYNGYGRIFFWLEVPRTVIASAPLFGVGPGRFGGGVAATRGDTSVYDRFGLPFGVQDVYGQIDNSFLAFISEFGIIGFLLFSLLGLYTMKMGREMYKHAHSPFLVFMGAIGYALPLSLLVVSFFGPYLELRVLSLIWCIAVGMLLCGYHTYRRHPANFIV